MDKRLSESQHSTSSKVKEDKLQFGKKWRSDLRNVAESTASEGPLCSRLAGGRGGLRSRRHPRRGLRCYNTNYLLLKTHNFYKPLSQIYLGVVSLKFLKWQRAPRSCSVPTTLSAT